jgi:hypothetical protein
MSPFRRGVGGGQAQARGRSALRGENAESATQPTVTTILTERWQVPAKRVHTELFGVA